MPGPVVTMYEFEPASGVKVSKIVNLTDDLALVMRAVSVRIVAPVPGKAVVGIEIPNVGREPVVLRDVLISRKFREHPSPLAVALGKDILGNPALHPKIPGFLPKPSVLEVSTPVPPGRASGN